MNAKTPRRMTPWTPEDEQTLRRLKTEGHPWHIIASELGRGENACTVKWSRMTRGRVCRQRTPMKIRLGQQIAALRRSHGMTQQQLSDETGLYIKTIHRLESGQSLSPMSLEKVLDYLDADLAIVTDYEQATPEDEA